MSEAARACKSGQVSQPVHRCKLSKIAALKLNLVMLQRDHSVICIRSCEWASSKCWNLQFKKRSSNFEKAFKKSCWLAKNVIPFAWCDCCKYDLQFLTVSRKRRKFTKLWKSLYKLNFELYFAGNRQRNSNFIMFNAGLQSFTKSYETYFFSKIIAKISTLLLPRFLFHFVTNFIL